MIVLDDRPVEPVGGRNGRDYTELVQQKGR